VTEDEEYKRVNFDKFKNLSTVFQVGTSPVATVACDANNRLLLSEGRDCSEGLSGDRRMILEWILRKLGGRVSIGFIWLRTRSGFWLFENSNEPLGSTKGRQFRDRLGTVSSSQEGLLVACRN
jgi:hypothetical protein